MSNRYYQRERLVAFNRYGVSSVDDMTEETYRSAINSLKKTKSRVAKLKIPQGKGC